MINWKKDGASTGSLLKDDYHVHSDKISASIRHLPQRRSLPLIKQARKLRHRSGQRRDSACSQKLLNAAARDTRAW